MMSGNRPESAAMLPGLRKIPDPITLPTTIAMAVAGPNARKRDGPLDFGSADVGGPERFKL
jgi:hypothetical protein